MWREAACILYIHRVVSKYLGISRIKKRPSAELKTEQSAGLNSSGWKSGLGYMGVYPERRRIIPYSGLAEKKKKEHNVPLLAISYTKA